MSQTLTNISLSNITKYNKTALGPYWVNHPLIYSVIDFIGQLCNKGAL